MKRFSQKISSLLLLALLLGQSLTAEAQDKRKNQRSFSKTVEVMASSMALLDRYFVDSVDMDRLGRQGIDAMLQSLDPYTEYYSKEDADKLKLITRGEYGGIGAIISQRPDSVVIINEPMEHMPADLAGLKAGDIILEIDGKSFRKATTEQVSAALKGVPGSKISVLVQRRGERKPRKVEFVRRIVSIKPVTYAGFTPKGFAYIAVGSFSETTAKDVRTTIDSLAGIKPLQGLVLDFRGNGGGLMQEAIKLVSLFVPSGKVVVTTKARPELGQDATYRTKGKAPYPDMPLVVLINGESASSSEIVAGALQDMDRAIIVGRKSFGKGLVQTTMSLPRDGILKLTTAKYYMPSGRCVQVIDYEERRTGRKAQTSKSDSLAKVFYTSLGRPVKEAGGVMPDVEVKGDSLPTILYYLTYNNDVFDWVTDYTKAHKQIAPAQSFRLTDEEYKSFSEMLIASKFDYDRQSSKELDKLREIARIEGYLSKVAPLLDSLEQKLSPDLGHDLVSLRPHIEQFLSTEIVGRYYYRKGVAERNMLSDKILAEAEDILSKPERQKTILSAPQTKAEN